MGNYVSKTAAVLRIDTDEPIRAWAGFGALDVPADDVAEPEGGVYLGIGLLLNQPSYSNLLNGIAATTEIRLGAVWPRVAALIEAGAAEVEGRTVTFGRANLDAHDQLISVDWKQSYLIELITRDEVQTGDDEGPVTHANTIVISLGSGDGSRRRPSGRSWTGDQAGSGDLAFEHVPGMTMQATRRFPPKGK